MLILWTLLTFLLSKVFCLLLLFFFWSSVLVFVDSVILDTVWCKMAYWTVGMGILVENRFPVFQFLGNWQTIPLSIPVGANDVTESSAVNSKRGAQAVQMLESLVTLHYKRRQQGNLQYLQSGYFTKGRKYYQHGETFAHTTCNNY